MRDLIDYVNKYAVRGACRCGQCVDRVENPEEKQPTGHTADLIFFKVAAQPGASRTELVELVAVNTKGEFGDVDVFDGREHSYLELGGWIGDQGTALMLMGLGAVLGCWRLLTPRIVLGLKDEESVMKFAGMGYVTIVGMKDA